MARCYEWSGAGIIAWNHNDQYVEAHVTRINDMVYLHLHFSDVHCNDNSLQLSPEFTIDHGLIIPVFIVAQKSYLVLSDDGRIKLMDSYVHNPQYPLAVANPEFNIGVDIYRSYQARPTKLNCKLLDEQYCKLWIDEWSRKVSGYQRRQTFDYLFDGV